MKSLAHAARTSFAAILRAARLHPLMAAVAVAVAIPCALLFSVQVRSLLGPLYGVHEWRQGWTYSVAYAFVHESASFFYPKHAWRGSLSGIVGMEVPIYPYVASLLMRVFGDSPVSGRLLSFVPFVFAFGLQCRRLGQLHGFPAALGYLVMMAFSPVVLCEFRQFQPDPLMAALAVLAAVIFQDHGRTGTRGSFALGLSVYTVALLTKSIAIAILPAMYLFSVLGPRRPSLRGAVLRLACFAIPIALLAGWDKWANVLVERYMEGRSIISIEHDPKQMWAEAKNVGLQRLILLGLLESWVTHVVLFPAVLLGIPYALRKETRAWGLPYLAWLLGMVAISLAFSSRYPSNWYYMLLFAPPVLLFGALGLGRVFDVVCRRARDPLSLGMALALVLAGVLITPLLDPVPWGRLEHVIPQLAVHVRQHVSQRELYWIAIVVALLLAASLLACRDQLLRVPHVVLALVLGVGAASAMVIPFRDTRQTVRFYAGELEWKTGYRDSREIQQAVARYSTPRDLFLMNGSNPALLVRALRVGYADDAGFIDQLGAAFYRERGVRFFMQFFDSPGFPVSMRGLPLLAQGERWALYCLDARGCPPLAP